MKKNALLALALCVSLHAFSQSANFNKVYALALQENLALALHHLDTLTNNQLTEAQQAVKERFYRRFRTQNEAYDFQTTDSALIQLQQHYQAYWKKALLNPAQAAVYEKQLQEDIGQFLTAHHYTNDGSVKGDMVNNFTQHLKHFLKQKGYYAATGKTGSLFDLLVWAKEVKTVYDVKLPRGRAATTVIFLENTITLGWEEYATLGRNYPGGWATNEQLYCVRKAYDTTSEDFKVSYLKHEGQHFADYKAFPKLTGADLEYRAKLTELYYADQTLYDVIRVFTRNASKEGRNAHAFGNYCVIRDLSKKIFHQEFVTDPEQWKKISASRIRQASNQLLKAHTRGLRKAGAQTVTEYVR